MATLFLLLVFLQNAHGQSITGTLVGTASDAQGAVVPAAAVKTTNVETGISRTSVTNDRG